MYIRDPTRNKFIVTQYDRSMYNDPDYYYDAFEGINYDAYL